MLQWTADNILIDNGINSVLFLVAILLLRTVLVRALRASGRKWPSEVRRRWIRTVRSISWAASILGLAYIWSEQVYAFAVSIFAVAIAAVLAVKELLLCVHGSWVRIRSGSYAVGDRIEVDGIRGDVIHINLLSTTILEVGPGELSHQQTGRSICIPNSMLLENPVTNESFLENFLLHNIVVPLKREEDWSRAKDLLLELANEECAPYLDQARKKAFEIDRKEAVDFPSVDPRVSVQLPDAENVDLILRIPTPTHLKGRIERNITDRFLEIFSQSQEKSKNQSIGGFETLSNVQTE